ncbi:hypothetical protein BDV93DRAFT_607481 [Ceratobasidium sp. AG-I]|nr:hypothetical protein BDV93DRAFT_607481 [Ceratobasidium sp. AG-I]
MLSLPPEISTLIVAEFRLRDLSHLAQTSHAMLDRFVPFLWENVESDYLFELLPGADFDQTKRGGNIPIPLPTNYFDRFRFYARNVKSLSMNTDWDHSECQLSHHKLAWPSVLSYASTYVLFPNLTKLGLRLLDKRSPIHWDWATLFIVPTLTEVECHGIIPANLKQSRVFDWMLSKCLDLGQMTLSVNRHDRPWDRFACSPVPQSLRSLNARDGEMGIPFLSWIGRMPQLENLDIYPDWWGGTPNTLPDTEFPPESFPALVSLTLGGEDNELMAYLFRTPITTNLTKLAFDVRTSRYVNVTASEVFALLATGSPRLQELQCSGYFQLEDPDIISLHPLLLRSLKFIIHGALGPELSLTALSGLSPKLEVLTLGNYVSLESAMRLPLQLPRLVALDIHTDLRTIPDVVDTSHLFGASLERTRVIWRSHVFALTIRSDQWENAAPAQLDMCSKILAMTWPHMKLHLHDSEFSPYSIPNIHLVQEGVDYYTNSVLQSGERGHF